MEILMAIIGLAALVLGLFYFGPYLIEVLVRFVMTLQEKTRRATEQKIKEWREIINAIREGSDDNGKKPK